MAMNWRSVASSAASGMLLIKPIVMHRLDPSKTVADEFPPATGTCKPSDSSRTGIVFSRGLGRTADEFSRLRNGECRHKIDRHGNLVGRERLSAKSQNIALYGGVIDRSASRCRFQH